jgi:hypothetical protein
MWVVVAPSDKFSQADADRFIESFKIKKRLQAKNPRVAKQL